MQPYNLSSSQPHDVTSSQPHDVTSSQPHDVTSSQPHDVTSSQPHDVTSSQPHDVTSSQPHDVTSSQPHDVTSSQPHDVTSSQPHNITQLPQSTSSTDGLPAVATEGDYPGNQPTNEVDGTSSQLSSSSLHELATPPLSHPSSTGAVIEAEDSMIYANQDVPYDDGSSRDVPLSNTSKSVLSQDNPSEDKDAPSVDGRESTLYRDDSAESDTQIHDRAKATTAVATHNGDINHSAGSTIREDVAIETAVTATPPPPLPSSEDKAAVQAQENDKTPTPAPFAKELQQKLHTKPAILKPKPPVAKKPPKSLRTRPVESKGTTSTGNQLHSPSSKRISTALSQKRKTPSKLARGSVSSSDEVPSADHSDKFSAEDDDSSGDEYVPTDDEEASVSAGPSEPGTPDPLAEGVETTPPPIPPPPVPVRTKNYHQVILPTDGSKVVIQEIEEKGKLSPAKVSPAHDKRDSSPSPLHQTGNDAGDANSSTSPQHQTGNDAGDAKKSKDDKSKRKRFYDRWVLKKDRGKPTSKSVDDSPSSGGSPMKEDNKQKAKAGKKLKHSQSDRKATSIRPSVQRAPSDPARPMTPPAGRVTPRATFLNMSRRPLPQPPFALRPDDYEDHDKDAYDLIDTFNPIHSLPPAGFWGQDAPTFPGGSPAAPHERLFSESTDYMNDDQCPKPATQRESPSIAPQAPTIPRFSSSSLPRSHASSAYPHVHNPNPATGQSHPATGQSHPEVGQLRPAIGQLHPVTGQLPLSLSLPRPHASSVAYPQSAHDPTMSLPAQFSTRRMLPEPAHPLSVPHPLPHSAIHSSTDGLRRPPLLRRSSGPSNPQDLLSPEYDYPKIPGLGMLQALPSRYPRQNASFPLMGGGRPIARSRSTEFDNDQYVDMKMAVPMPEPRTARDDGDDDDSYQNWEVVKSIRGGRSQSLEDLHLYKNWAPSGPPPSIINQPTSIPLPARTTNAPRFFLPPRNLPRQHATEMSPPAAVSLLSASLSLSPPHSQVPDITVASAAPQPSPRPVPKRRVAVGHPKTSPLSSPLNSPPHTTHQPHQPARQLPTQPVMASPSLQQPQESLPHLAYIPEFSKSDKPGKPTPVSSVGTSTWSEDNDPAAQYYNVVSKSFFSPPKPLFSSDQDNSYVDILPE